MGFVYVIGPSEPMEPYRVKIGKADNVCRRLADLQIGSPLRLQILCIIQAENPLALEDSLHGELAEYRAHGEWFELPGDPVATVKAAVAGIRASSARGGSTFRLTRTGLGCPGPA